MKLINADCIAAMKEMHSNSVDSIVTDPPYELGFMGKSWDASGIAFNIEVWKEALRILKPGGHLIAFSGSRTYHRMAVAIEDAGFQIRDQIMWVYGSGFPKSHNISKAIDKNNGETGRLLKFTNWMRTTGLKAKQLDEATGTNMGGHYLTTASQPAIPTVLLWQKIRPLIADVPEWVDELVQRIEAEREVIGTKPSSLGGTVAAGERDQEIIDYHKNKIVDITAPATPAAQQWDGWGTALKPAHEPMVLARKPLEGTVANNVMTWGVGGLNIDGTRVGYQEGEVDFTKQQNQTATATVKMGGAKPGDSIQMFKENGRFPANFIHDGSDEVVALFPTLHGSGNKSDTGDGQDKDYEASSYQISYAGRANRDYGSKGGSAARFFYCAKASKRDRNEGALNNHPTVKPTSLMQYLVKLVTPPNGTVFDPFMGSGSTGKACAYEGFDFIGIDQSAEYVEIAQARIDFALQELKK
jgi:DNA modification methylase